ncbi:hypothetical protein KR032_007100 [Drosophila birchii]|nr:hypothetical protein KR032_007100 [Drosophila birchii]
MLTVAEIYHGFGLLIGMTSYRLVNGRYQQSRITRAYAMILNIVVICSLPFTYWHIASGLTMTPWLPGMMFLVPFVLYMAMYVVVAYILVSRSQRDSLLIDLLDLTEHLTRKMERAGLRRNQKLQRLLHLKSFIFAFLNLGPLLAMLFQSDFIKAALISLGYSIIYLTTYFYFASFWQLARGYDFVSQQLGSGKTSAEEIRNLWSLHFRLGRMARRINKIYGLQMLACRLDHIISSIIYGHAGIHFVNKGITFLGAYSTLILLLRTVDFFLNDFVCELTLRYQCQPKDELSEGAMSRELSDFLIYERSLQLNLKVCGLYSVNRSQFLQMIGFIVSNAILLVQFYLILKAEHIK